MESESLTESFETAGPSPSQATAYAARFGLEAASVSLSDADSEEAIAHRSSPHSREPTGLTPHRELTRESPHRSGYLQHD